MKKTKPTIKSKIIATRLFLFFHLFYFILIQSEGLAQKSAIHPFLRIDHTQCCTNPDEPRSNRNSKVDNVNDIIPPVSEFDKSCEVCETFSQPYIIDTIQYVGHSENTYDLVILAEGYTEGQIASFRTDAKKVKESLLKNDVYPKLLPKMNIFSIGTISKESGISLRTRSPLPTDPIQTPRIKNTFFGIYFLNSYRAYYLDDTTTFKAKNLASELIPFSDVVLILTNDEERSSGRASFFGVAVATKFNASNTLWSDYLVNHELAHSVGAIADEYFGAGKEIAFNKDITNDPSKIRWKDMLNIPGCGIESVEEGVYIPNSLCMMCNGASSYTCPVCSLRLKKVVEDVSKKIPDPHRIILSNFDKEKRTITYTWDPIPQASNYEIILWASWRNNFISKTTSDNKVTFDLTPEDVSSIPGWRIRMQIRAFNSVSSTRFQNFQTSIYASVNLSVPIASSIQKTSDNSYKITLSSKDNAAKMNWFRLFNEEGLHTDILTFKDSIELKNLKKDKNYFYQIAAAFPEETGDFFASPFSQKLPLAQRPDPPAPKDIELCQFAEASPIDLKFDNGNTLRWYDSDTATNGSLTPPVISTQRAGMILYFITQVNSQGLESNKSPINITVKPKYSPPVVQDKEYCQNTNWPSIDIKPDVGNTLKWYTSDTSSIGSTNNPVLSINTSNPGLTKYFVTQTNPLGCESNKARFEVVINPQPSRPQTEGSEVCQNSKITSLNVKSDDGNKLLWYTTVTGGTGSQAIPNVNTSSPGNIQLFVTQVSAKGCESLNSQVSVTIRPLPQPPIAKDKELCQFAETSSIEVNYDQTNSLIWYTSPTSTMGSASQPAFSTLVAGIPLQFYVSQINKLGCESTKSIVNIKVKPKYSPPVVQDKEYCQNTNLPSIDIKPDEGNTLKWYTSDTSSIGSTNNPVLSINTSNPGLTNYFVTQTNPQGCESNKAKFEVRINPQPSRPETEESEVCQNSKITSLKVKVDDGNQMLWYTSVTGGTPNQMIPDISTSMPGFARLWVTQVSKKGCESLNAQVSIIIAAPPAIPTLTLLNNLEIRSSAAKNLWFLNNNLLPDSLQTLVPKVSGNYTAVAINRQCRSQPSLPLSFVSTSLLDEELRNFTIQPNPFSDFITINYENTDKTISKIDFFSLTGEVVKSVENLDSRSVIDVTDLSAGIYFLRIQTETFDRRPFFKLIKY